MTIRAETLSLAVDCDAVAGYVLGRRTPEGGYCYYRTPGWGVEEPNAPDTLAALECLRILGVDPPEPETAGHWLRGLQTHDGGYATLTIGWGALRALDVLGLAPRRSPQAWLEQWAAQLLDPSGQREWRGAIGDLLHLVELLRLTGSDPHAERRERLVVMLDAASDTGGGWARPGADLETTALAVLLVGLAGLPDELASPARDFLRRCEHNVLGLRLSPSAGTTSAGALWGGLELARALELTLCYPDAIADSLGVLQRPNGGLGARHWAISTLRDTWLGLRAAHLLEQQKEHRS
jgi:hypothetical protein